MFGSGYLANTGTIAALAGPGDVVFSDELNHASIIDGCRLSRAEVFVYRHRDTEHLEWGLRRAGARASLIVSDGVFSMDGDVAPLRELHGLAARHRCKLMVDEAHGTGALGPGGRGAVAAAGLGGDVDVVVGTLGKALGGYGAYVCVSSQVAELLVNTARPFIYSTAPPPPAVGAALAALTILREHPGMVEQLRRNAGTLREGLGAYGLDLGGSRTQIIPVMVGDARRAMALCEHALERGVFAQAIRPPTVPEGTSRLRLAVMATHSAEELRDAARVIGQSAVELGLAGPTPGRAHTGEHDRIERAA
ncbi:MAG: aminotransferase class I/II-fold pyridoxal phosphate-dependent enzyme [Solirubrobacterales bacterium]